MKNIKSDHKLSLKLVLGLSFLLSGATALTQPALAQSASPATLYEHCNYGGYAVGINAGNSNYGDLIRGGAKNDDVSSIKLAPGYKIEIFRDANYQGPSKTFDKDVNCLISHEMNDFLSSVKVSKVSEVAPVTPPPTTIVERTPVPATLYQHCNYRGYAVGLEAGDSNYSQLLSLGAKNDDVSSIKLAPGYKIEIFRDANYQGPSKTFDKDVDCLVTHEMNDFLSSVKVSKISEAPPLTPVGNTSEQECFDMVQGKVAWNREGEKQWDPNNIRALCKGTTNPKQTIACFEGGIMHRTTRKAATADCTSGATHSYLSGVKHKDGAFMSSHFINGQNVSAAYVENGRFEESEDNSKTWTEYDNKGKAVFTFIETGRDEWSVYMTDESRDVKLQVDVHRKMVGIDDGSGMRDLYEVEHFSEFHQIP